MRAFKDSGGNTWQIDLPFGEVIRVKKADTRFNLLDPSESNLHEKLHRDLAEFWEFLWILIEPQAAPKQIDAEKFGRLMTPECLLAAQGEFFKEWADFFRSLQRPHEAVALEKLGAYQKKAIELVTARLDGPEMAKLDAQVETKMSAILNESFGNLAASLESTPDRSPSES